ncbi:MAG: hypothetical protein AB7O67_11430 [Vicinamibacterales bacterium]
MRRIAWMSLALAMLGWWATPSAQAPPDLSGRWSMDLAESQSPTYPGFEGPVTLVVDQKADVVRIETIRGQDKKSSTAIYPIHDSAPADSGTAAAKALAYWDGSALVVEGMKDVQGKTVNTRQRFSLGPDKEELHVVSIVIVQHGYTIEGTENFGEAEDIYTRQQ